MIHMEGYGRRRTYLPLFAGILLAAVLPALPHVSSAAGPAKGASVRTSGALAEAKSLKLSKPVSNPFPSIHRDLLNLEEGQRGLQRQLEGMSSATRRRTDDLEQRTDSLTNQLNRMTAIQQQNAAAQESLTAIMRSMRMLLVIIAGLLALLCGALFLFRYRLKHSSGFELKDARQIGASPGERPDQSFEPQWKVSS